MVWGWLGFFINRFWTFMVDFEVSLVSEWLNTSDGIWGLRKISCFWAKIQKISRFQIFVFGPQRGLYRVWMGPGAFLDIKWGVYVVFR